MGIQIETKRKNKMSRVYIRIPRGIYEREIDDEFGRYGKIENIDIKSGGYAFIDFRDTRDAEDAVAEMNGKTVWGDRIVVEFARAKGAGAGDRDACFNCGRPGHWARDCREPPRARGRGGGGRGYYDDYYRRSRSRSPRRYSRSRSRSYSPYYRRRSRSRSPRRYRSRSRSRSRRRSYTRSRSRSPRRRSRSRSPRRSRTPRSRSAS